MFLTFRKIRPSKSDLKKASRKPLFHLMNSSTIAPP